MFTLFQPHDVQLMLADLPARERGRIWRKALLAAAQRYPKQIIVGLLIWQGGMIYLDDSGTPNHVLLVAGVILGLLAYIWISLQRTRAYVRRGLALIGRCAGCGYDVRETKGTCPECGAPV